MSSDRTSEFLSLARSLPRTVAPKAPASGNMSQAAKNPAYTQLRTFHATAAEISHDIAATSALLKELTDMVRRKSLLQDDSADMNHLVVRIKTSMENLNSRLDVAATVILQQKRALGKNSQAGQEAANLVDGLKTEFAVTAGSFKQVLQQRTDNMKESDDMQRQVYGNMGAAAGNDDPMPTLSLAPPPVYGTSMASDSASSFPTLDLTSGMMAPGESTSSLPRPHGISGSSTTDYYADQQGIRNRRTSPDGGGGANAMPMYSGSYSSFHQNSGTGPLTPFDIQRMEDEQQLQTQLIPDQDYLRERADAMSTVETNIVELGSIFNKLAIMVNEHAEMVQRVEDNVEESNTNINLSLGVLTDTLTNLKTNRALALRVFSILVAFIIMFIIFFA